MAGTLCAVKLVFSLGATLVATLAVAGSATSAPDGLIVYWSSSPVPSIWSIRPDGSERHRILKTSAIASATLPRSEMGCF